MTPDQIYQQNNALQNYAQGQAGQFSNQYAQNQQQFNQAQQNLGNYQKNLPDLGQIYQQNLGGAEQQFGFNPQEMKNAQQALAATQTTMANLPQAVQQAANGRGLTAAQQANRYAQSAGNLNSVLAGQANNVNALNNVYANALQQAGQGTSFTQQTQQLNLGALQNLAQNAQAQEAQAAQQLDYFNSLRAQGVSLNVQEQTAEAQAAAAMAQAAAIRQQTEMMAAQAALYGQYEKGQSAAQLVNSPGGQAVQNYGNPAPDYLGSFLGGIGNTISSNFNNPFLDPGKALAGLFSR